MKEVSEITEPQTAVVDVQSLLQRELNESVILLVDDEPHILRAISRLLSPTDHKVVTAANGQEALEALDRHRVAVIMSDQRMPGMSGAELLRHARELHPNTVRLMITGNNDVTTAVEAINQGEVFRFVLKPWNNDDLLRVVEAAFEHHRLLAGKEIYEHHIEAQNDQLRELNEDLERRVHERTREVVTQAQKIQQLYTELESSFDATIKALLSIMELGNVAIIKHCRRTASRALQLCDALDIDLESSRAIERAALLHWIGLINAPLTLFKKDVDQLDASERASWEFHPLLGQQAIAHIPALEPASEIILHYLRRYDDPGFRGGSSDVFDRPPEPGLVRACQVLHICSTFERVQTIRQHQGEAEAWLAFEEGIARLEAGRGSAFDPELVDEFVRVVSDEYLGTSREEVCCQLEALEPGMVLSRPLETVQGIPVAPREMVITTELIDRLYRFQATNGLKDIYVWS